MRRPMPTSFPKISLLEIREYFYFFNSSICHRKRIIDTMTLRALLSQLTLAMESYAAIRAQI